MLTHEIDISPAFSRKQINQFVAERLSRLQLEAPGTEARFYTACPVKFTDNHERCREGQVGIIQIDMPGHVSRVAHKFQCTATDLENYTFWRPCDDHTLGVAASETYLAFARLGLHPC